jgi:hypothetical protein
VLVIVKINLLFLFVFVCLWLIVFVCVLFVLFINLLTIITVDIRYIVISSTNIVQFHYLLLRNIMMCSKKWKLHSNLVDDTFFKRYSDSFFSFRCLLVDSTLMASSCTWSEGKKTVATCDFQVGYGGGGVEVEKGSNIWLDSYGRVLVGWHGTHSPPRGMDGESMV